jgi:hypothetical protein
MVQRWYAVKTLYRTRVVGRPSRPDAAYQGEATLVEEVANKLLAPTAHKHALACSSPRNPVSFPPSPSSLLIF